MSINNIEKCFLYAGGISSSKNKSGRWNPDINYLRIQFSHCNIWHLSISYHDSPTYEKIDNDAQVLTKIVEIGTEREELLYRFNLILSNILLIMAAVMYFYAILI